MKIVIMTTSYNAEKYISRCIKSVKSQTYTNYIMVITDDLSTDNSVGVVKEAIKDDARFRLIENTSKLYAAGNHKQIGDLLEVSNDDILVCLDGDDWFYDNNVLARVVNYYNNPNILMSFGQFVHWDGKNIYPGFTKSPLSWDVRNVPWTTSHLKTFRAGVLKKVNVSDLQITPNNFFPMAGDLAIIYPMLEMVGPNRVLFTNDINLVYNCENVNNEYKINLQLQDKCANMIRSRQPYSYVEVF